jgi:hypothetical protein
MSSPPPSELNELFGWFQGIPGSMDKFVKLPMSNKKGDDEFIQNIGLSLGIEAPVWKDMTHDKRLLTIYEQLPDDEKLEFKKAKPHLFKGSYPENSDMTNQFEKLLEFSTKIDKTMNDKLIGIMREYDKDEKNLVVDATTERARLDKMISTIGILLNIENWEDKTYDDKLKILVGKHSDNLFARNEKKTSLGEGFDPLRYLYDVGGRNKSKKPKRRNSRSKRRNSRSKRRKTLSKRRR